MASYSIHVSEAEIADLKRRIRDTRWPDAVGTDDWRYGTDESFLRSFLQQWECFDWRHVENEVNAYEQFLLKLDHSDLHVIRISSGVLGAVPILLCHGRPSSFLEMIPLGRCLASTESSDSPVNLPFDVVIPSLPGFGFSRPKLHRPWSLQEYCDCLFQGMTELGYDRFAVHAYDVAASIMSLGAFRFPERIIAYHTTEPAIPAPFLGPGSPPLTQAEEAYLQIQKSWESELGAYLLLLRTKPQTVAYGLADSPAATASWILEKWKDWTDPGGPPNAFISMDHLLAQASLFWFTNSLSSANRIYLRDRSGGPWLQSAETKIRVPTGVTLNGTQAIERAPQEYASRVYADIRYWKELSQGGHFIAIQRPDLLASSIRDFLTTVMSS